VRKSKQRRCQALPSFSPSDLSLTDHQQTDLWYRVSRHPRFGSFFFGGGVRAKGTGYVSPTGMGRKVGQGDVAMRRKEEA